MGLVSEEVKFLIMYFNANLSTKSGFGYIESEDQLTFILTSHHLRNTYET
jgi:hypothetical protein